MQSKTTGWGRHIHMLMLLGVLLVQLYLRLHNVLQMPIYTDEVQHITRAQMVYRFDTNPLTFGHGKLLFYYWIGLLAPCHTLNGLFVARAAVVLTSLLTVAGIMAVARELAGRRAMLPAALFYALVPQALFFERLAIADPVATAFSTLAVWQCIRMAQYPSVRHGALAAVLIVAAVLAKLTLVGLLLMPFIAVGLLSGELSRCAGDSADFRARVTQVVRRYRMVLIGALGVVLLPVLLVMVWGVITLVTGQSLNVMDIKPGQTGSVAGRYDQLAEITRLMVSVPLILVVVIAMIVWRKPPRPLLFILSWWGALVLPIAVLAATQRARYVMVGLPALACLVGMLSVRAMDGLHAALSTALPRRVPRYAAAALGVLLVVGCWSLWAVGFALPFAQTAYGQPERLDLPALDKHNYLHGPTNGWGVREALDYLRDTCEREDDGTIPAVGVVWGCKLGEPYLTPDIAWGCYNYSTHGLYTTDDAYTWEALIQCAPFDDAPFLYVIDDDRPPTWRSPEAAVQWELLRCFDEPMKERPVCVWRVEPEPDAG